MSEIPLQYGVIKGNVVMTDMSKEKSQRTALFGSIVKIEGILGDKNLSVKFLKDDGKTWQNTMFCTKRDYVIPVREKLWPFLNAIHSPEARVKLAENRTRCEKLLRISFNDTVGFSDVDHVYLGTVKYIGEVKGMGKCLGIQLHEKKPDNRCNGSCAGEQYFNCLPGYGLFTTIERVAPYHDNENIQPNKSVATNEIDDLTERNISRISIKFKDEESKPAHEEITTRYSEYPKRTSDIKNHNSTYFRNSISLQNILDSGESNTVNTNNDFDQNSMIQPDNIHLVNGTQKTTNTVSKMVIPINKNKSEMDLIDVIGGSWSGTTDPQQLQAFAHLKKNSDHHSDKNQRASYSSTLSKGTRNRSTNPLSHLIEGSKTLPRKSKLLENINGRDGSSNSVSINGQSGLKLNEKLDALPKSTNATPSTSQEQEKIVYYDPDPGTTNDLSVGSLVEVLNDVSDEPLYGVIRWMGIESQSKFVLVGVELENEQPHLPLVLTDGMHNGERFFKCASKRALFVPLTQCHRDSRFQDGIPTPVHQLPNKVFEKECPVIPGSVAPLCMPTEEDVEAVCGKLRGIQGHHNSCYLDVTLFSMFTYTAVFDSLLFRPKGPDDIPHYEEVQRVLREEIVNPLRKNLFVSADRVMNLRRLLDQLSSVSGLTSEEKDPEEFLHSLLAQILKAEPFLKLNSGQEAYHYQLFVEKDDGLTLPTVQQLFEQSFLTSDIKLKEVPSCLIIQMPRFGKSYKMYPRILPSQLLDVTDVIEDSPRQCTVCGKLAKWECRQCLGECGVGLESIAFCAKCIEKAHCHERRIAHSPRQLHVSQDFAIMENHCSPPRLFMELFAVICIETSHYVAFVKCGVGHEAPWCFFDSMADRRGEKNGYNIPEMVACPDISKWLSDEQSCRALHETSPLDRFLPEHARRLLCDAYICMYQSPDVMMYR